MQEHGYRIIPVNPRYESILGERCHASLATIDVAVDIVDVFRKGSDIPFVLDEAIAIGAKTVWVQLGIWHQDAAIYGESTGLAIVIAR